MADSTRTVRVKILGRVQMVFFRAWTQTQAKELGLSGWVCNRDDGSVEAVFRGTSSLVSKMIQVCHNGPPLAEVESVHVEDYHQPVGDRFVVR